MNSQHVSMRLAAWKQLTDPHTDWLLAAMGDKFLNRCFSQIRVVTKWGNGNRSHKIFALLEKEGKIQKWSPVYNLQQFWKKSSKLKSEKLTLSINFYAKNLKRNNSFLCEHLHVHVRVCFCVRGCVLCVHLQTMHDKKFQRPSILTPQGIEKGARQ